MTQIKAEMAQASAQIQRLTALITSGVEYRDVACDVVINRARMRRFVVRVDTGECVADEPLRDLGL